MARRARFTGGGATHTRCVRSPRPQVFIGPLPRLLDDLVRRSLIGSGAEVLPRHCGLGALRRAGHDETPPLVVLATSGTPPGFEREVLYRHPDSVVAYLQSQAGVLAVQMLEPWYRELGELRGESLAELIDSLPSWNERFA
jgi:hypothetical protein